MSPLINILLVEDDEVDIMNVQRAFKRVNVSHPLFIARNGVEALEMLRKKNNPLHPPIRIILLDLNMPKMGGIQFLTELRRDPELRSISVFVMTTSAEENDKISAHNLNVAGYILKPLSFKSFTKAVEILNHYWQLCEQPIYSAINVRTQ